jgi:hypothetical protein
MGWITNIFSGGAGKLIEQIGNTVDKFVTTDKEKAELKRELDLQIRDFAMKEYEAQAKDRQSARQMYMKDSGLQKTYAIIFLIGYLTITGFLIYAIFFSEVFRDMANWEVALISTIFTAMSTKVNTITDFLFGGSKQADNTAESISKNLKSGK